MTWPEATVQTCIVHMVRNSSALRVEEALVDDHRQMRAIYPPRPSPRPRQFRRLRRQWRIIPGDDQLVGDVWNEFVPFLAFPVELRKIVYTTNAIESLNARFRRAVRIEDTSPTSKPRSRSSTSSPRRRRKNREDITGRINGWKKS